MWKPEYEENRRRRKAADPEYKKRIDSQRSRTPEENREYMRVYYLANKGKFKKTPEQQAKHNTARRTRYQTDAAYRAATIAEVKESRKKHPETRFARELRKYGLTIADYKRLLAEQGGGCAICGRKDTADSRGHRLHVDHCHATGRVRGILCGVCNLGIGKFKDDPERLERAALYLRSQIGEASADRQT